MGFGHPVSPYRAGSIGITGASERENSVRWWHKLRIENPGGRNGLGIAIPAAPASM
jgi:hypothetical protein